MNTKIIDYVADYVNAYEDYRNKISPSNADMKKLKDVYFKILSKSEKYSDDYDRFIDSCNKKDLFTRFQKYSGELKKILLDEQRSNR